MATLAERIHDMDEASLKSLEANARRLSQSSGPKTADALQALELIAATRENRSRQLLAQEAEVKDQIRTNMLGLTLADRAHEAFTRQPVEAWERAVLQAIHNEPGRDFNYLAKRLGKADGGYINLAVGSLCSAREPFLGVAPIAKRGARVKNYSSLIIDFEEHVEPSGQRCTTWTLKPEVAQVLLELNVLRPRND